MNENIHIHTDNHFDKTKLVIVMIPCLIFILVLLVYLSITSYETQIAASTSATKVLGTSNK